MPLYARHVIIVRASASDGIRVEHGSPFAFQSTESRKIKVFQISSWMTEYAMPCHAINGGTTMMRHRGILERSARS
jgi:hypothetical protein